MVVTLAGGAVVFVRRFPEFDEFSDVDVACEDVDSNVILTSLVRFVPVEQLSLEFESAAKEFLEPF